MSSSKQANVSVIIPCYCCVDTVERALISVLQQTIPAVEIILVDDASNDNGATLACLRQLCETSAQRSDVPIQLITLQENGGPSVARNAAWDRAKAEYVAFLDADDVWHPKKLEIQYGWMAAHPEVSLSGHYSQYVDGEILPTSEITTHWSAKPCKFRSILFRNPLLTRTVMMHRNILLRFAVDKRYSEDYLLWLQAVVSGKEAFVLSVVLAYSFKPSYDASGLSGDLWRMESGELDNFRRLHRDKSISSVMYITVNLFSLMKYFWRVINVVRRGRTISR